jgi:hypothetical protein
MTPSAGSRASNAKAARARFRRLCRDHRGHAVRRHERCTTLGVVSGVASDRAWRDRASGKRPAVGVSDADRQPTLPRSRGGREKERRGSPAAPPPKDQAKM